MDWIGGRAEMPRSTSAAAPPTDRSSSTSSTPITVEMDAKVTAKDPFVFSVSDSSDPPDDAPTMQNDSQSDDEMSDFSLNFSEDDDTKGMGIANIF